MSLKYCMPNAVSNIYFHLLFFKGAEYSPHGLIELCVIDPGEGLGMLGTG